MIILIDFENTHGSGFQGVEYLDEKDTLVVYYSDENSAVSRGLVDDLKEKNVHVRMVKLLKQHSNALDMYIDSTTGMFLDTGEKICIVSKDRGYAAVRDFWHSLRGAEILLGETIEECFLHSEGNDDERIRRAKERSEKILLTESFDTMNNIPTKPTLSRSNYWRRRKQTNFDLSKNLYPVEILPNPLAKPGLEEASPSDEEAAVDGMALLQELADSLKIPEESTPVDTDASRTKSEEKGQEKQGGIASAVEKKTDARKKTEDREIHKAEGQKEEVQQAKKKPGNQLRFVYDPVKKAMIKVSGTEAEREESPVPAVSNKEEMPNEKEEVLLEKEAGNKKKSTGRRRRTSAKKEAVHQEEPAESSKKEEKAGTTVSPKTKDKRKSGHPHKEEERGKDNNPVKDASAVKKEDNKPENKQENQQENKQENQQEDKQENQQENKQEEKKENKLENSAEGTGEKKTHRRRRTAKKESPKA